MRILAIDPGLSGAWSVIVDGRPILCGDMPTAGDGSRRRVTASSLASIMAVKPINLCVVELAGAMPGQGVSSTFRFGVAFGTVLGVAGTLEVPIELVAPAVWKRHFRIVGSDKELSRAKAIDLAPHLTSMLDRVRDHNRAEAVLIGMYDAATLDQARAAA
jgi:hypothetical protein